jgi:hypothetical protein
MKQVKNKWTNKRTEELEQASQLTGTDSQLQKVETMDMIYPSSQNTLLKDKLKLTELAKILEVKSLRTAISWCKKHGVATFNKGKLKFVYLIDFNLAVDSPFIESLKIKFPQNWSEIYATYKRLDYEKLVELLVPQNALSRRKFSVEGNVANNFLEKMKNNF